MVLDLEWTRQTRFVLWAGSGQAYAPGACPTVLSYPSTRQSHWKCLSGFGEAAPARLPADLPDFREFPPGAAIPGNSREFPTPEISLPGNWPTIGRSANFDSDCDSEGFMCTGSSARASGLRELQLALYILDTRGNERRAVVRTPAARGRAPCRARRPGAAPRGPRPRPRSPASSSIIGVALVVGESLPAQKLVGLAIDLHRRRHALLDHRRFDEEVGVRSSPVPIGAERLLACGAAAAGCTPQS